LQKERLKSIAKAYTDGVPVYEAAVKDDFK